MVVHTKSASAEDGRRAVLEFLLANHPLDCPVCDQSGECDLQNFYLNFGLYNPRFREQKVKKKKAVALGPHVMLDQERCILCSRCVRFTDEITRTGEFGIFTWRSGSSGSTGVVLDSPIRNVIDICPVGAREPGVSRKAGLVSLERPRSATAAPPAATSTSFRSRAASERRRPRPALKPRQAPTSTGGGCATRAFRVPLDRCERLAEVRRGRSRRGRRRSHHRGAFEDPKIESSLRSSRKSSS
jgi:ferredoxin